MNISYRVERIICHSNHVSACLSFWAESSSKEQWVVGNISVHGSTLRDRWHALFSMLCFGTLVLISRGPQGWSRSLKVCVVGVCCLTSHATDGRLISSSLLLMFCFMSVESSSWFYDVKESELFCFLLFNTGSKSLIWNKLVYVLKLFFYCENFYYSWHDIKTPTEYVIFFLLCIVCF